MLAPEFFTNNLNISSFGAFAAGFFARPIGAMVFGMLGDRHGRRLPLIYSMTLVGVPTIIIGFTPSYQDISFVSPLILIICRALQGFFNGGEFAGINLLIAESENEQRKGASSGFLIATGVFGTVIAALIGAVVALEMLPAWGWRLPFVVGGLASLSFLFATHHFGETQGFQKQQQSTKTHTTPWHTLIRDYKQTLLCAVLLSGFTLVPLYLATIFGNQIFKDIGYTHSESLGLNALAMLIDGCAIILFGRLADRIGFDKQIRMGLMLAMLVALPAFYIINTEQTTLIHAFLFIMPLVLTGSLVASCAFIYISNLFPIECRYSALALSITLGQAIFGGTTPMVASYLVGVFQSQLAPALWVMGLSGVTLIILNMLSLKQNSELLDINCNILQPAEN